MHGGGKAEGTRGKGKKRDDDWKERKEIERQVKELERTEREGRNENEWVM